MSQWTPPPPPGPPMPPPSGPAHAPGTKSQWWKAWWALLVGGLLVGIALGGAVGSGERKTETIYAPTQTATVTNTETATATVQVTTTPTKVIATHTHTATVIYTPPPVHQFSDGTYRIGPDVPAGTYKTKGGSDCYYAILNSLDNTDIAQNDNFSGPNVVQLSSNNAAFEVSGGCTWSKIG